MVLFGKKNYLPLSILTGIIIFFPILTRNPYHISVLNLIGLNALVVVGLNLLIGYAGQISLGHAAFYAMGAYFSGILTTKFGFPSWPTIALAMLLTGFVAYMIGVPSLKLKGHYLVMATLAFSLIVYVFLVQMVWLTGGPSGLGGIPSLKFLGFEFNSDFRMYYLIWFFCFLAILCSLNLVQNRVGRALRAIHDSEIAANTSGVDTKRYKVKVFVLSAVFASFSGSLYAHYINFVSPDSFTFIYSVQVVTMVIVGGMGSIWGSLFGASILTILSQLLHAVKEYNIISFGAILAFVLMFFPEGIVFGLANLYKQHKKFFFQLKPSLTILQPLATAINLNRPSSATDPPLCSRRNNHGTILKLHKLQKSFGGLMAVNDVSLDFKKGNISALIGPNGAGKTTILNIISGIYKPNSGKVYLQEYDISSLRPFLIAKLGITRTFQNVKIFKNMTVLENVMVGFHPKTNSEFMSCLLNLPKVEREEEFALEVAYKALEFTDLASRGNAMSSSLPYGEQKRLEIARALAINPRLILLDEPAAGLNAVETEEISRLIVEIRDQGISVILVEHNMDVVMGIADKVIVLNYGEKIAEGEAKNIQDDERVIKAYLGE